MVCLGNRDLWSYEWFSSLSPSDQHGPVEDWMREFYPSMVSVDRNHAPLNEWGRLLDLFCVSAKVKNLIEQLEPATHQFLPVELRYGDKSHQYFILKFGHSIDAVDVEEANVEWMRNRIGWFPPFPGHPLTLRREIIGNAQLWQNKSLPDLKFMSDALHDLLENNGATKGLLFQQHNDV
jgi:hypothetical protein